MSMSYVISTVEKPKSGRRITPTYYGFLSLESDKHEHKQSYIVLVVFFFAKYSELQEKHKLTDENKHILL